ncbi:MAG: hypothetical protein PHI33_01645 [Smithellaceae bacterium]|nr:hypothetical protein [Smithellaceae bacterium]
MAAVIKGTTYVVSFNNAALANVTLTSVRETKGDNNEEVIQDASGATSAIIYMDPFTQYDIEGVCSAAPTTLAKGATVQFTPPGGVAMSFRCDRYESAYVAGATRVSMTIIKEDSMTYT